MFPLTPRVGAYYAWESHGRESTLCCWIRSGRHARYWGGTNSNFGVPPVTYEGEARAAYLICAREAGDSADVKVRIRPGADIARAAKRTSNLYLTADIRRCESAAGCFMAEPDPLPSSAFLDDFSLKQLLGLSL